MDRIVADQDVCLLPTKMIILLVVLQCRIIIASPFISHDFSRYITHEKLLCRAQACLDI